MTWIGIDVGGARKGFHAALLQEDLTVGFLEFRGGSAVADAVSWVRSARPACVAVDSPAQWAAPGRRARACEVEFARAGICGIRFTPDAATAAARTDSYYGWIEHGLQLWRALEADAVPVIECFPTASFTQWMGSRDGRSRAAWTRRAVAHLTSQGLSEAAAAQNQDRRDAIAAALTARQACVAPRAMLAFGPLQVPASATDPLAARREDEP